MRSSQKMNASIILKILWYVIWSLNNKILKQLKFLGNDLGPVKNSIDLLSLEVQIRIYMHTYLERLS